MQSEPAGVASYRVVFDGTVQNLWTALGLSAVESALIELQVQADAGNAAVFEFGGSDVDASGVVIPVPSGGVPAAPLILRASKGGQLFLSQLYVKGTGAQAVRLLAIPFTG